MKFRLIMTLAALAILAIVFLIVESNKSVTNTPPASSDGISIQ